MISIVITFVVSDPFFVYIWEVLKFLVNIFFMDQLFLKCSYVMNSKTKTRKYSMHPLIRTHKGPDILFELANVRNIDP